MGHCSSQQWHRVIAPWGALQVYCGTKGHHFCLSSPWHGHEASCEGILIKEQIPLAWDGILVTCSHNVGAHQRASRDQRTIWHLRTDGPDPEQVMEDVAALGWRTQGNQKTMTTGVESVVMSCSSLHQPCPGHSALPEDDFYFCKKYS